VKSSKERLLGLTKAATERFKDSSPEEQEKRKEIQELARRKFDESYHEPIGRKLDVRI
jgi:hypothetical protein